MSKIPQEQGSEEWLNWRRTHVCASDLPIILRTAPKHWGTPYTLWQRKLKFIPEVEDNYAMRMGREKESFVRELVCGETGINFEPKVVVHQEIEWAAASLDGINKEQDEILEIKCPSKEDHKEASNGKIPEKYKSQVQWQLFVTGCDKGIYASFNEGLEMVSFEKDEEYITQTLLPIASDFYKCLMQYEPPPLEEDDYIEITDESFNDAAENWKYAKNVLKTSEERERYFRNVLISHTDDSNAFGCGVKLTRVQRDGSMDWKSLLEDIKNEYPDFYEKFDLSDYKKKQIGYWKVSEII